MTGRTAFNFLKYSFIIGISILIMPFFFYFTFSDYPSFLYDLLASIRRTNDLEDLLHNPILLWGYRSLKIIGFLLILLYFVWLYDFIWPNKRKLSHWLN